MANKTRANIRARLLDYLPQMAAPAKLLLLNDLIDYTVEKISKRHDFRCLRAPAFDAATLSPGAYTLPLSSFPVMGAANSGYKDILNMFWMTPGTQDYYPMNFIDDQTWQNKYGYVDWPTAPRDKPSEYTMIGGNIWFNCQASETLIIRVFWQMYHRDFQTLATVLNITNPDTVPHQFDAKSNQLAFMTIVYGVLLESKSELVGDEAPQDIQDPETRFERLLTRLIADDKDVANEQIRIGPGERQMPGPSLGDPYWWTR